MKVENLHYLYYIGWTRGHIEPLFYAGIGLAISDDGCKTFQKHGNVPIIPRDSNNPLLMTSPCVFKDANIYRMVYVSGLKWVLENNKLQSHYRICSAISNDGVFWTDTGRVLINCSEKYTNYARPWVTKTIISTLCFIHFLQRFLLTKLVCQSLPISLIGMISLPI